MKIKGLCVSCGTAKGPAYIIKSENKQRISDISLLPNTILVMKSLDRSILVNLNKNVIGVVAEHGNIGSHGSGILRQLGIPCVLRINGATELLKNGELVEICDAENCIICFDQKGNNDQQELSKNTDFEYQSISKPQFSIDEIRPVEKWIKPRPGRVYQKLRYDIISDVYVSSVEYIYKMPSALTRQDSNGVIEVFGTPNLPDLCSFVLCNPYWLIEKAKERSTEFNRIKIDMANLLRYDDCNSVNDICYVFNESVRLYKSIFKYLFLSQVTSDEMLDIYLDFLNLITGKEMSKDVFNLRSNYVEKSLSSGHDPGGFQKWGENVTPHIWDGEIDYTPFPIDNSIIDKIENSEADNQRLMRDYSSFRVVIPLIYQLSEEFFYMSKSINSFLNWSIVNLHRLLSQKKLLNSSLNDFYNIPLNEVFKYIKLLKGDYSMDNKFMEAFHPDETLVKDFQHWVVLVRENQLTLGNCYFVLKREIPFFGQMNSEESAELSCVMKWYEEKCRLLFGAEKFNYVAAMMRDNFVHFHAFPRYSKPVSRYGIEWKDDRWPRLLQFGPSVCEPTYYQLIKEDLKEN